MSLVRVAKVLRSLRVIRLVRVAKLNRSNFILMAQDKLESERLFILSYLFKHLCVVLVINHFTACLWYGFGSIEIDGYGNWVSFYLSKQKSWVWAYFTSLHWSLAQFANGEVLVEPKNIPERLVSIIVLLLSMMIFSSFLAIVGNTVHQMLEAGSQKRSEVWLLRLFLRQHSISLDLKVRVNRYIGVMITERQKRLHPSAVILIQALSKPLQAELQTEMWTPLLVSHPLFWMIGTWHKSLMRQVCANTIKQFDLSSGDVLFCFGEEVRHLYFVVQGVLKYARQREIGYDPPYSLEAGMWICEAALWAERWMTCGACYADVETELVGIDGDEFRQIAMKHYGITIQVMRDYGIAFVRNMNKAGADDSLSDLQMNMLDDGPFGILIDFGNVAAEHEDLNGETAMEFRRRFRHIAQRKMSKVWGKSKANGPMSDACEKAARLGQSIYSNSDDSCRSSIQEKKGKKPFSRVSWALGFGGSRSSGRGSLGSNCSKQSFFGGVSTTPNSSFPLGGGSETSSRSPRRSMVSIRDTFRGSS